MKWIQSDTIVYAKSSRNSFFVCLLPLIKTGQVLLYCSYCMHMCGSVPVWQENSFNFYTVEVLFYTAVRANSAHYSFHNPK